MSDQRLDRSAALDRLRSHNVVQWSLGYAAVAWGLAQVVEVIQGPWGLSDTFVRGTHLALAAGIPAVIVRAWFHGKRGRQSGSRVELALLASILLAAAAGIMFLAPGVNEEGNAPLLDRLSSAPRRSLAVLPFVNMSSDPENAYFSDGITEDMITALSKLSGLKVAARTSSFAFRDRSAAIQDIGSQLNVGALLLGSVARNGNRVRVNVELVNVEDGYGLWSESYDRELQDVFAIRSEVAQTVARELEVRLEVGERGLLDREPTEDLEAYQLYLRGREAVATYSDFTAAMRYFQQAIDIDPDYALAHLGMAYCYTMTVDWVFPAHEAMPRARAEAEEALRLDPSLAEAHTWLGFVSWWYEHDLPATRQEFETALAMAPENPITQAAYGWFLVSMEETEAGLVASRRAVTLDPLDQEVNAWLGLSFYLARRYDDAIEQLRLTTAMDPDYWFPHAWLGRAFAQVGRYDEASVALLEAKRLEPENLEIDAAIGRVHADAGYRKGAESVLEHLQNPAPGERVSASYVATVAIGLGDFETAMASLAKASEQREWLVVNWRTDPELDPVRSDPRFDRLLRQAGQEP